MKFSELKKADLTTLSTSSLVTKYQTLSTFTNRGPNLVSKKIRTRINFLKKRIEIELLKRGVQLQKIKQNLNSFKPFQIKNPYLVITGSVLYDTPHDFDIIIFTPFNLKYDPFAPLVIKELNRYLPEKTHWINSYYTTPFSPYIPIYNLELTPKILKRGYAPMYPKNSKGELIKIDLSRLLSGLPGRVLLKKNLIYYSPRTNTIIIPQLPAQYYVPLYVRLLRQFPEEVRPTISTLKTTTSPKNAIPVYDLVLTKADTKLIKM